MEQTLQLQNRLADLALAEAALDALTAAGHLPDTTATEVRLAFEEAFTNIVKYAHPDGRQDHPVGLRLALAAGWLELELSDAGVAHDPFARPVDELAKPFAERADGLMGIPLIRALMDECRYRRDRGHNLLLLRKRLPPTPPL